MPGAAHCRQVSLTRLASRLARLLKRVLWCYDAASKLDITHSVQGTLWVGWRAKHALFFCSTSAEEAGSQLQRMECVCQLKRALQLLPCMDRGIVGHFEHVGPCVLLRVSHLERH